MNRRRLEEGLIACLPWQFEDGKHGVEGGDHDSGFFFAFGRRGWGMGEMGLRSLSPEVCRVVVWMEKTGDAVLFRSDQEQRQRICLDRVLMSP